MARSMVRMLIVSIILAAVVETMCEKYIKVELTNEITPEDLNEILGAEYHETAVSDFVAALLAETADKDKPNTLLGKFSVNYLLAMNNYDPDTHCTHDKFEERRKICETFCTEMECWDFRGYSQTEGDGNVRAYLGMYCWGINSRAKQICWWMD